MPVVALQHVAVEGPGSIADAVKRAGRSIRTIHLYDGEPVPVGPEGIDGLVVMGGPMGISDTHEYPHLEQEMRLVADCLDAGVPVLGVCLGAQLMAATLGATVRRGSTFELGWRPVQLGPAAAADPLFAGLPPRLTPLHWHGDVFDLPDAAVALASSAQTPVQAFRYGPCAYGLLFHLEADLRQVTAMAAAFPDDLARGGLRTDEIVDREALNAVAPLAEQVFDAWVRLLG